MPKARTAKKPAAKQAAKAAKKLAPLPPNMAWISAYLTVKDPTIALAFYETAFGFKKGLVMPAKDGKILHAEILYKDNMVMFGPENLPMGCKSPTTLGGTPVGLYIYVDAVDALTERARKAGGKIVREPQDQFYGDRTVTIGDPDGHQWTFATRKSEFDPSKAPNCE